MRTLDCQRPSARAALLRPVGRGRGEGEPCSPRAPGAKAPFAFGDSARKATRRGRHGIDGTRPPGRDGARRGGHGGGCPGVRAARGMTAWDATWAAWTTQRRGHQSLRISGGTLASFLGNASGLSACLESLPDRPSIDRWTTGPADAGAGCAGRGQWQTGSPLQYGRVRRRPCRRLLRAHRFSFGFSGSGR